MTALRKLLVVDDDPVVGASFNRVLSGRGYIVVSAANGAEALERLHADKFDAVFTDLRMPGMDGVQVAERVHSEQPWVPVVIVTGYGSAATEARARAVGVSAFISKPLSPEQIVESAEEAVSGMPAGGVPSTAVSTAPAAVAPQVEPAAPAKQAAPAVRVLRNMALFLAAPFIGLAYAVLLPFVGVAMLLWVAFFDKGDGVAAAKPAAPAVALQPVAPAEGRVVERAPPVARATALDAVKMVLGIVAAPFIGLAFIVVLPFAGLTALGLMGLKAVFVRAS